MRPLEIAHGVCGVYKITNLVNGKRYVGCSMDVRLRWIDHRARRNRSHHLSISRAFQKHGIDNFSFELLEECTPEKLEEREIHWISKLRPEYNRTPGGSGKGRKLSPEVKAILSRKGKEQWAKLTPEKRRQMVESNLTGPRIGVTRSLEVRQKISAALTGRIIGPRSQQVKDAICNGILKRGEAWGAARWKPVVQINGDGRIVWYWASASLAAEHFHIHPSTITQAIKGRRKTAGGFRWAAANVRAGLPVQEIFHEHTESSHSV